MSNARALRSIHFPSSMAERDIARRRLAYEECLYLQLALRLRNDGGLVDVVPYAHTAGEHLGALKQALPFSLSDEQEAAFQDILHDMCDGGRVMNRLLLGDVGTGKTAVAACALAVAADSGTQACVMAPTGVLARQYADKTGPLLSQAGMSWALLTGATPAAERERIHAQLNRASLTCSLAPTRFFRITLRSSICRSWSSMNSTGLASANATPCARRDRVPICSL
ncbi:MAG: DEAD/DEAH box helicase [Collinsella aerofaciens]